MLLAIACTAVAQHNAIPAQTSILCRITKDELKSLNAEVKRKIDSLKTAGKLDFSKYKMVQENNTIAKSAKTNNILFRWPLTTSYYRDYASWHIGNFVDLNPNSIFNYDNDGDGYDDVLNDPREVDDYHCGDRTYDGHQGIDIGIDPYKWEMKNEGAITVIAAADGIIVYRHDGEYDENCAFQSFTGTLGRGNHIVILHDDGTTASFYMHMKSGSVTLKQEGDYIYAGEYIGKVASSGNSTGPHLHFQVNTGYVDSANGNDESGVKLDPFANGDCTVSVSTSWLNELPYTDPAVLNMETLGSAPVYYDSNCDKTIDRMFKNSFGVNDSIYCQAMLRDWVDGSILRDTVFKPDGNVYATNYSNNYSYYHVAYTTPIAKKVSLFDLAGTYRYKVSFGGKAYSHYFAIKCQTTKTLAGISTGQKGTMVSDSIVSTQTIDGVDTNYTKYMADGHVTLKPGFRASAGCRFVANTEGCNNSTKAKNQTEPVAAVVANNAATKNAGKNANGLRIFPNPSSGIFTMQFSPNKIGDATVTIKNMMGQIVYALPQQKNILQLNRQINLNNMPKGIYIVEVNTGMERITEKVLIQ